MSRLYETQSSAHQKAVSKALLDAAGDDPASVRTTTGTNGRLAFQVDDDFPDVNVPEPGDDEDGTGALHPDVSGILGDTQQAQETGTQEENASRRRKGKAERQQQEQQREQDQQQK